MCGKKWKFLQTLRAFFCEDLPTVHWGEQDSFSLQTVYKRKKSRKNLHPTLFSPFLLIPVNKAYPEPVTLLVYFCFYIDFGETLMNSSFWGGYKCIDKIYIFTLICTIPMSQKHTKLGIFWGGKHWPPLRITHYCLLTECILKKKNGIFGQFYHLHVKKTSLNVA